MNVIQREFFILGKNPTRNTPQELAIQTQANKNVKKIFLFFSSSFFVVSFAIDESSVVDSTFTVLFSKKIYIKGE